VQNLCGEALLFAQQTQQQVLRANVLMGEALGLFRGIGEHALALVAEREVHGRGHLLANRSVAFNLFPNGFDRRMLPEEPIGERLVFAQEPKKQVFGLYIRRAELAGFVAREEDNASGLFCVPFKHLNLQSPSVLVCANYGSPCHQLTPDPHPVVRITPAWSY
jgi:hypothetical protein